MLGRPCRCRGGGSSSLCPAGPPSLPFVSLCVRGDTSNVRGGPAGMAVLLFSCQVVSDSLWAHGLQHARLPCPSLSPGACSNSWPLSQWCHPAISSSVDPSSCPQSFPASGSFLMSQFFASGGQSIRASASASVLPMNIQDWFPLGLTGLISLLSKGLSRVFSSTTIGKHQFFSAQPSLLSTLPSVHVVKTIALLVRTFVSKVMPLPFDILSRLFIAFLPRTKHHFMATVTIHSDFGAQENKICHCFNSFPFYLPWSDGTRCHDLSFLNIEF